MASGRLLQVQQWLLLFFFYLVIPFFLLILPVNANWQDHLDVSLKDSEGGVFYHDLVVSSQTNNAPPLVQSTSGYLENGQLCGILGPSGAGKTTFLNAIVEQSWRVKNHTLLQLSSNQVAFLSQYDTFFTQLTVQEVLELAAFLELPDMDDTEQRERIHETLFQLGLYDERHRPIGDPTQKHGTQRLSGGERRRLSVGLELLTNKEILLADEPTSGLDSTYSLTVVKLLKQLAVSRNIPAFASLHQPRSSIWEALDCILLMAPGGRVCYFGPVDSVVEYFGRLGYTIPLYSNPADFLVDLVSIDDEDDEARIQHLARSFRDHQTRGWKRKEAPHAEIEIVRPNRSNGSCVVPSATAIRFRWTRWIPRLGALIRRSWRQNIRNVNLNLLRLIMSAGNAWMLAGILPISKAGVYLSSVADRVALLSFSAINFAMMTYMKAVTLFSQERPVVQREQTRHQYSVLEYVIAKAVAELPLDLVFAVVFTSSLKVFSGVVISWRKLTTVFSWLTMASSTLGYMLGSIAPDDRYATLSGLPVLILLMVVGVINPSGVDPNAQKPLLLRLLKQLSPFAFSIEALVLGEYPGIKFTSENGGWLSRVRDGPRMGGLALVRNGDQVVDALGLKGQTFHNALRHLAVLSGVNLLFSWVGMMWMQRQQQRHRPDGSDKRGRKSVSSANGRPWRIRMFRNFGAR